jgi:hypothetical protein
MADVVYLLLNEQHCTHQQHLHGSDVRLTVCPAVQLAIQLEVSF